MNCGLIGCGRIAHKHLAAMKENDICEPMKLFL